jgi:hypothetical protein
MKMEVRSSRAGSAWGRERRAPEELAGPQAGLGLVRCAAAVAGRRNQWVMMMALTAWT